MSGTLPRRAHVITGGFPPGSLAGHDHDHARLKLLGLLAGLEMPASVSGDFADIGKWLPVSRLLVTYVAGPYPDAGQTAALRAWLEAGGHWLGLHGTSGGRAERVEGHRMRRTIRTEHHGLLGAFFLTHPPQCSFRVDVADRDHPVTRGLGASFEVQDEPYFVEVRDLAAAKVLLTATYGDAAISDAFPGMYPADTSLLPDGRTRVLGYTKPVGKGAVTYIALGHCHGPASRAGRPADTVPATFRGPWESPDFMALLRNAMIWDVSGG